MTKRRNQKGQILVESLLLMVVLLSVFVLVTRYVRDNKLITNLVTKPWAKVAGMAEFGVWDEATAAARSKHPNNFDRAFTPRD